MTRGERPKGKAGRAQRGDVLAEGMFLFHKIGGLGSVVSSPSGVRGEAPSTWQLRTF